jgi:hypothetical protein
MTEEEQKRASALTHKWARHFDGQGTMPTQPVLQSLATIAHYARWLEEQQGRTPDQTSTYEKHSRAGWWNQFLEILGIR